ncbi:MAG: four helix bundle protein [Candidatus Daviesbacteria bacterium]|nr:four helix bundle protein [Candidatus Daviesbacteria bacterium]
MYKEAPIYSIRERSLQFSVRIIQLIRTFPKDTSGFAIGNQIIRSGTSVGANIEEAQNCGSKKEFIHTMTISLKEARETEYWLKIINEVKLADQTLVKKLLLEVNELIKILTVIVKKTKLNS